MKDLEIIADEIPNWEEATLFAASGKTEQRLQRFMLNASLTPWSVEKTDPNPRRKTKTNRKKSKAARKARRKNR